MAKPSPSAVSNSSEFTVLNSYETPEPSRFPFGMPEGVPYEAAKGGVPASAPKARVPSSVPETGKSDPEDWLRDIEDFDPKVPAPKHPNLRGGGLPVPVDPQGDVRRMEARLRDQHEAELRGEEQYGLRLRQHLLYLCDFFLGYVDHVEFVCLLWRVRK